MKRITAIGLILLMSLQCLYQLGVITYFQLNHEYIAKVLCINREKPVSKCNGQCFLKDRLELAEDTTDDRDALPSSTQRIDLPVFLLTESYQPVQEFRQVEKRNLPYLLTTSSAHRPAPFHPPALLS